MAEQKLTPYKQALRKRQIQENNRKFEEATLAADRLYNNLSEAHRAWFGALIDGEGAVCASISASYKRSSTLRANWAVVISNTNLRLLEVALERWPAAAIRPRKLYGEARIMQRRPMYAWEARGVAATKSFLVAIMPHLIIKRRQAELLYALLCWTNMPTRTKEIRDRRIAIARQVQIENQKGKGVIQ